MFPGDAADSPNPFDRPHAPLDSLLEEHLPTLNAYVRLRTGPALGHKESISDLVQSTCREALQRYERVPSLDDLDFRYWLFALAERKIRNKARHWRAERRDRRREVRTMSAAEERELAAAYGRFHSPSHGVVLSDEYERVERAMNTLPPDYREVILLHHLAGLPHRAIAARMERTEGAVRQLLSKALARLARRLDRSQSGASAETRERGGSSE